VGLAVYSPEQVSKLVSVAKDLRRPSKLVRPREAEIASGSAA
jgi:hypothetical protein